MLRAWSILGTLLGCVLMATAWAAPLRGDLGVHDPSTIITCKGRYYLFGTGKGITTRTSTDKVYWTVGPRVFPTIPAWMTNAVPAFDGTVWAPDISYFNGQYRLYYSISSWGSQQSVIGLATNPTLDPTDPAYSWTDQGPVIRSQPGDPYNTIDPCIMVEANGRVWMSYGSYWTGIYLVELDPQTGLRLAPNSPLTRVAYNSSIEASCLYQRGGYYYLFVNWGSCCVGVNSTYHVRVGRSTNVTGPYLDRHGVDLAQNGGSLFLEGTGKYTGPGHMGVFSENGTEYFSYHYYDAGAYSTSYKAYGQANFDVRPLSWTADGWPAFTNDWSAIYEFRADARDRNGQHSGLLRDGASITHDPTQGRVLTLSGTNQYVELPPGVAYARSFTAMVKWRGGGAWQRLFDFGTDTSRYVMLTPSSGSGKLTCHIKAGAEVQVLEGPNPLPVGVWTRVGVTFDGQRGVLYVNGQAVATNNAMSLSPLDVHAQTNHLGRSKFSVDPYFKGEISHFRASGRVLSATEMAAPLGVIAPVKPSQGSFYPFGHGASDASNRWDGTLVSGANVTTDAARGSVLDLNGSGAHVSLPAGAGNAQTISAWVKWRGGAPWQRIFDFGQDSVRWFFLTPSDGDGKLQCNISAGPSTYPRVLQAPAPLPANVWTHVAVSLNGAEEILYVNGEAVAINHSVNLLPSDVAPTKCYLGRSQFPADPTLNGQLDSVRLETRPFTLEEILSPRPVITAPVSNWHWAGGTTLSFAGSATDYADTELPATNLTWTIDRIEDGLPGTLWGPVAGQRQGQWTIPDRSAWSTNIFLRVTVTAKDANTFVQSASVDVSPQVSLLHFATVPEGLRLDLEGLPLTASALSLIAGMRKTIGTTSPQQLGGVDYPFVLWSDGGARTHEIVVPTVDTSFTASFLEPRLEVRTGPADLSLRWPEWAATLQLEWSPSLTPPAVWTAVTNLVLAAGSFRECALPNRPGNSFYRLRSP